MRNFVSYEKGAPLTPNTASIPIATHIGTWYVIDTTTFMGRTVHLLEHEDYGDEAACLIVDENCVLLLDEAWNGFDDLEDLDDDDLEEWLNS